MSTPWLQITVELVEGRDLVLWPRPGRVFAASPTHAFGALAGGIDSAFARWDQSHLHEFRRQNGERVGRADPDWDSGDVLDERERKLSRLEAGEELLYIFDFGDGWHHLVTVGTERLDPREQFGVAPRHPVVLFGWETSPINTAAALPTTTAVRGSQPTHGGRTSTSLPVVGRRSAPLRHLSAASTADYSRLVVTGGCRQDRR
jgi:hypothetical protein